MGNRQKYIHNFARTLMGQLGIGAHSFDNILEFGFGMSGRYGLLECELCSKYARVVFERVHKLNDSVRGRLGACGVAATDSHYGKTSLQVAVHYATIYGGWSTHDSLSGDRILSSLGAASVLAAMVDNVIEDRDSERAIVNATVGPFLIAIEDTKFVSWSGVEYGVCVRKSGIGDQFSDKYFLDKDDPALVAAGITKRGGNFINRDKQRAAEALVQTMNFEVEDDREATLFVADKSFIVWNNDDGLYRPAG